MIDFKKRFEELKNSSTRTSNIKTNNNSIAEWIILKTKKNKTLKDYIRLIQLELQN